MQRALAVPAGLAPATRLQRVDQRAALRAALAVTAVATLAAVVAAAPELWLLAAVSFAFLVLVEPRVGLYAAIAVVGLEYAPSDPLTAPVRYVYLAVDNTASLPGLVATPVEMLVLWTAAAWLLRGVTSMDRPWYWPNRYLFGGAVVLTALLLLGVDRGVSSGGDLTIALWEVRALLVVLPMMLLVNALITERRHLCELAAVLVLALFFVAGESFWRYLSYVRPGTYSGPPEFAFGHENGVLISLLMVIGVCWALWGTDRRQRLVAVAVAAFAALVLLAIRRRSGLLVGEAGLLLVGMVLLIQNWRRFLLFTPIIALGAVVYLNVYWDHPQSLGQPARVFRSVFDSESLSSRDRSSDDYRTREKLNMWWAIQDNQVQGLGFGKEYPKPFPLPDLSTWWPFWDYIPHNMIMWLWLKGGVLTFMAFWFLVGSALSQLAGLARRAEDGWPRTAATSTLAFLIMLLMFSYIDVGLGNPRLTILLGASLGSVTVLERLFAPGRGQGTGAGRNRPLREAAGPSGLFAPGRGQGTPAGRKGPPGEPAGPLSGPRLRVPAPDGPGPTPEISSIICTYGRPDLIGQAVASVLSNDHPSFELLVVDQSADSATRDALSGFQSDARFRYLHLDRVGLSAAYNAGIQATASPLLAFTDDDCVAPPHWLSGIAAAFQRHPDVELLHGQTLVPPDLAHTPGVVPSLVLRQAEKIGKPGGFRICAMGANFALRRTLVQRIGGFDEALGGGGPLRSSQDFDLQYRAYQGGAVCLLEPEVWVYHYGLRRREQWRDTMVAYGIGDGAFFLKHVRCGDLTALRLLLTRMSRLFAREARKPLQRRRMEWAYLRSYLTGMRRSLGYDVDRRTRLYRLGEADRR